MTRSSSRRRREIRRPNRIDGGVESGSAGAYALELDSATAVRAVNALVGAGTPAQIAMEASGKLPAGSVLFAADKATRDLLKEAGRTYGLTFRRVKSSDIPATEPIDRVPRIAVLTGAVNQDVWSLRNLGFTADPVSVATINTAPTDPLVNYDVIWNTGGWPSAANPTARGAADRVLRGRRRLPRSRRERRQLPHRRRSRWSG